MQPKVSVVTVFLDGENFLAEAVRSVFAQTLDGWELVLVDDGSSDTSGAWAEALAAREPRVRCLTFPGRENRGLAAGRILGAEAARGEYLLFLDHDDVLYPSALATLAAALDADPRAAAAFAGVRYWAFDPASQAPEGEVRYRRFAGRRVPGRWMLRDLILSDARHPAICSSLFRRDAWLAARGCGDPWPDMYEDTAMLLRLLAARDACFVGEVLSAYRMHGGSMSHAAQTAGSFDPAGASADRLRFLEWARGAVRLDRLSRAVLAWAIWRARRALARGSPRTGHGSPRNAETVGDPGD